MTVLSGAVQPEKGYRLLWLWQHAWLARLVLANALAALVWGGLGAGWLADASGTSPSLYAAAVCLCLLLLLLSALWLLLLLAPCLALCRCPLGMPLIGFMAGSHHAPHQRWVRHERVDSRAPPGGVAVSEHQGKHDYELV